MLHRIPSETLLGERSPFSAHNIRASVEGKLGVEGHAHHGECQGPPRSLGRGTGVVQPGVSTVPGLPNNQGRTFHSDQTPIENRKPCRSRRKNRHSTCVVSIKQTRCSERRRSESNDKNRYRAYNARTELPG